MKTFFKNLKPDILINAAAALTLGVLLLLFPTGLSMWLGIICAAAIIVYANVQLILSIKAEQRGFRFALTVIISVLLLALGIGMIILRYNVAAFIDVLLALFLLYHGVMDLLYAIGQSRAGFAAWYVTLVVAIVAVVAAVLSLTGVYGVGALPAQILGGCLVFDGVSLLWGVSVMSVIRSKAAPAPAPSGEDGREIIVVEADEE